jgi:hypothetical protein
MGGGGGTVVTATIGFGSGARGEVAGDLAPTLLALTLAGGPLLTARGMAAPLCGTGRGDEAPVSGGGNPAI